MNGIESRALCEKVGTIDAGRHVPRRRKDDSHPCSQMRPWLHFSYLRLWVDLPQWVEKLSAKGIPGLRLYGQFIAGAAGAVGTMGATFAAIGATANQAA